MSIVALGQRDPRRDPRPGAPRRDVRQTNGQFAPDFPFGTTNLTLVASRAYYAKFTAERDWLAALIAFEVTTAAGADDTFRVGLYDETLTTELVTSGNVTGASGAVTGGGLNAAPGIRTVALTPTRLQVGVIYYARFSIGTLGGTAGALRGTSIGSASSCDLFGTGNGQREAATLTSGHTVGAGPITPTGGNQVPILAIRNT